MPDHRNTIATVKLSEGLQTVLPCGKAYVGGIRQVTKLTNLHMKVCLQCSLAETKHYEIDENVNFGKAGGLGKLKF
jgi:hypothetical protein